MDFWMKPVYIRVRVRSVLLLLLFLVLACTGIVLYRNYVFHNLFFQTLSENQIEGIYIYQEYQKESTILSNEDTQDVISLLNGIRLKEEPYKKFGVMGDRGNDYHIQMKNGKSFDLNVVFIGDRAYYIIGEDAYPVEYNENCAAIRALYREHRQKYYPQG